ncbi:MAG: branched-chain amino acid aminotransferase [Rhodospirillaceae bacterium]|jgi:branched-chain amino acid aminotransferase|nr:branched-chain amino acid aminotransferase [Rhodospirillaceae bacterium]MBT4042732.1 branched-chain amino acid aminotransferase [Rhodospirillaceae bacterium]MBT4689983.1 branched-chain amino acid aminotransferase [Rhodospirillaceae bacterium]MBT5081155.1 branched-chain amino acid aminotransferase [Rhodospirillaceae bacterium]MBT5523537.1 branched-chain amino acid aminotransferase [Rhodospirillaceae bacterium]
MNESLLNERVVYINGDYVPESRATISISDRGFIYGDAVFDTARTFAGKIYRLEEHVERLFRSLRYVQIDPGLNVAEFCAISEEVIERNLHLLGPDEDYWVYLRVTRGPNYPDGPGGDAGPTVIVTCVPLPLAKRAPLFRDGIDIVVPATRRTPPEALNPAAKTHNYLNLIVAGLETQKSAPDAWPLLLDTRGFLTEGSGSNIFLIHDGKVRTPKAQYVLAGVSRAVSMDLCRGLGLEIIEDDLSPFDAATADEGFITSTSLCLCPMRSFNGAPIGDGAVPGPITAKLMAAYKDEVGSDYVAQYLSHL